MDAVIFDVDGTLWDSTDEVAVSWNEVLREETDLERRVTSEELKKEFGKPLEEIMEDLFPELTKKDQLELSKALFLRQNKWMETAPCKVYEGVPEVIRQLAQTYKVCIVSNCQAGYIEAFLKNTGLGDAITDYTCPGDTGKLKAENIRIIMERNGFEKAVYVGDTQGDANACSQAEVPMIYAQYGFGQVEEEYPSIEKFCDLLELIPAMR